MVILRPTRCAYATVDVHKAGSGEASAHAVVPLCAAWCAIRIEAESSSRVHGSRRQRIRCFGLEGAVAGRRRGMRLPGGNGALERWRGSRLAARSAAAVRRFRSEGVQNTEALSSLTAWSISGSSVSAWETALAQA